MVMSTLLFLCEKALHVKKKCALRRRNRSRDFPLRPGGLSTLVNIFTCKYSKMPVLKDANLTEGVAARKPRLRKGLGPLNMFKLCAEIIHIFVMQPRHHFQFVGNEPLC